MNLFKAEKISIKGEQMNWKDTIRRAGKILLDGGFIGTDYIEK